MPKGDSFSDCRPQFGKVLNLRGHQFIDAIDKEKPIVTIVIHVYEDVCICFFRNSLFLNSDILFGA